MVWPNPSKSKERLTDRHDNADNESTPEKKKKKIRHFRDLFGEETRGFKFETWLDIPSTE